MKKQNYNAEWLLDRDTRVVRLADLEHATEVRINPSAGNRAYRMTVHGENILHFPPDDPGTIGKSRQLNGIPFLAPWANRMPGGFHANGQHYGFNMESTLIRVDGNGIPIHGLLTTFPGWEISDLAAGHDSAHVTSRLEFWRHPQLMTNWPFAHEYEMTYRLAGGVLEVRVAVVNRSMDDMPLAVGFHPYFVLPGVPISEATATVPVRAHVEADSRLIPTGSTTPIAFANPVSLADHHFDDGFTDLVRDPSGHARFSVEGRGRKIEIAFGPRYPVAIIYAPPGQNYICFEPMTALTNGINLAHEGKYTGLQTLKPGQRWEESFWIRTEGF